MASIMIVATFSSAGNAQCAERKVQEFFFKGLPCPVLKNDTICISADVAKKRLGLSPLEIEDYLYNRLEGVEYVTQLSISG